MKRLLPLASLALFACTAAPPPASTPVAAVTEPCTPGNALIQSVLWVQTSAEYEAAGIQTYAAARRALDEALGDPAWTGALEETGSQSGQAPAVILDLDETAIDNVVFEARAVRAGKTFDPKIWEEWTREASATAVPGAAEFLAYARSRGVTPFYVTNRDAPAERPGTRANLEKLGFPLASDPDTLLMRGDRPEWASDKSSRRAWVASSYRVVLMIGDDLNDFVNARDKSHSERDALIEQTKDWWGRKWFILPNPMYGSWERAAIGSGGTPCEQMQRKLDAIRP
jgi:acid phosphatase